MNNKFELVEKNNIDLYINKDGVSLAGKLPDKKVLRLYFMGYIAKVWKEWLIDIYGSNNRRKRNLSLGNQHIF